MRVSAPKEKKVMGVLNAICSKEKVRVKENVLQEIVEKSGRNLRRAVMMLQCSVVASAGRSVVVPEYEGYARSIAGEILKAQSPKK